MSETKYAECQVWNCDAKTAADAPHDDQLCEKHLPELRGKAYAIKTGPGTFHAELVAKDADK